MSFIKITASTEEQIATMEELQAVSQELRLLHNPLICTLIKDKIFKPEPYAASPHQPNVGRINTIEFIYWLLYGVS